MKLNKCILKTFSYLSIIILSFSILLFSCIPQKSNVPGAIKIGAFTDLIKQKQNHPFQTKQFSSESSIARGSGPIQTTTGDFTFSGPASGMFSTSSINMTNVQTKSGSISFEYGRDTQGKAFINKAVIAYSVNYKIITPDFSQNPPAGYSFNHTLNISNISFSSTDGNTFTFDSGGSGTTSYQYTKFELANNTICNRSVSFNGGIAASGGAFAINENGTADFNLNIFSTSATRQIGCFPCSAGSDFGGAITANINANIELIMHKLILTVDSGDPTNYQHNQDYYLATSEQSLRFILHNTYPAHHALIIKRTDADTGNRCRSVLSPPIKSYPSQTFQAFPYREVVYDTFNSILTEFDKENPIFLHEPKTLEWDGTGKAITVSNSIIKINLPNGNYKAIAYAEAIAFGTQIPEENAILRTEMDINLNNDETINLTAVPSSFIPDNSNTSTKLSVNVKAGGYWNLEVKSAGNPNSTTSVYSQYCGNASLALDWNGKAFDNVSQTFKPVPDGDYIVSAWFDKDPSKKVTTGVHVGNPTPTPTPTPSPVPTPTATPVSTPTPTSPPEDKCDNCNQNIDTTGKFLDDAITLQDNFSDDLNSYQNSIQNNNFNTKNYNSLGTSEIEQKIINDIEKFEQFDLSISNFILELDELTSVLDSQILLFSTSGFKIKKVGDGGDNSELDKAEAALIAGKRFLEEMKLKEAAEKAREAQILANKPKMYTGEVMIPIQIPLALLTKTLGIISKSLKLETQIGATVGKEVLKDTSNIKDLSNLPKITTVSKNSIQIELGNIKQIGRNICGKTFPFGFKSVEQFQNAVNKFKLASGTDDAIVGVRGSAATGQKFKGGSFDANSDIDFFMTSDNLFKQALNLGAKETNGSLRVSDTLKYFPNLAKVESQLSEEIGRKVSIRIYNKEGLNKVAKGSEILGK